MPTIKSKVEYVQLERDNLRIEVRRMRWPETRAWVKKFAIEASKFLTESGILDEGAKLQLPELLKNLTRIVEQSESLIEDLVRGSCRGLKDTELNEMDTLEYGEVLAAAVRVNLDDELKNCFAGVLAGVMGLMGSMQPETPTTSSGASMPILHEQGSPHLTSTSAPFSTSTSSSGT